MLPTQSHIQAFAQAGPLPATVPHLFPLAVRRGPRSRAPHCPGHSRLLQCPEQAPSSRGFRIRRWGSGRVTTWEWQHPPAPVRQRSRRHQSPQRRATRAGTRAPSFPASPGGKLTRAATLPSLRPASVQCGPRFLSCHLRDDTAQELLIRGKEPRTDKIAAGRTTPEVLPRSGT